MTRTFSTDVSDPAGAYAGYVAWKSWDRLFEFEAEQGLYFDGEMRGLAVAGADLLEIGYGSGAFLAWAQGKGARISGVEIIPELLEGARSRGIPLLPPVLEDVAPDYACAFDTIVAFDVFEHLPMDTVAQRLSACAVMLKPGGHLVLRFPNGQSPFGLVPQGGDSTHRSCLSRSAIEQLLQGSCLVVVRYAPSYRIAGGGLLTNLVRRMRYLARDVISASLNAIYAEGIPWDPVVTLVLRKSIDRAGEGRPDRGG